MIRKASIMKVFKGNETEYEKRHNPIWEELHAVLKSHGVHNYSIFLDDATGNLFAYAEVESEEKWNAIADTPICKKWWKHMESIMESNPDSSPKATPLREVFHID